MTDVVKQLRRWTQIGFVITVTMGLLLATSEMDKYNGKPYFQVKLCLLLLVGVHRSFSIAACTAIPKRLTGRRKCRAWRG